MNEEEIELKIIGLLESIRPFLINDGGDIEFIKYEDHIVYVRMSGACKGCSLIDVTLKDGIEEMIIGEIPEVEAVMEID